MKFLHENGCPWDKSVCEAAAEGGHLECLKYLHENGCPWGEDIKRCSGAAGGCPWRCPWTEGTCEDMALGTAEGGRLQCLKYLHEKGAHGTRKYVKQRLATWIFEVLVRARVCVGRGHVSTAS